MHWPNNARRKLAFLVRAQSELGQKFPRALRASFDGDGDWPRRLATTRSSPIVDWGAVHNLIPWLQMLQQQQRRHDGDVNGDGEGRRRRRRRPRLTDAAAAAEATATAMAKEMATADELTRTTEATAPGTAAATASGRVPKDGEMNGCCCCWLLCWNRIT